MLASSRQRIALPASCTRTRGRSHTPPIDPEVDVGRPSTSSASYLASLSHRDFRIGIVRMLGKWHLASGAGAGAVPVSRIRCFFHHQHGPIEKLVSRPASPYAWSCSVVRRLSSRCSTPVAPTTASEDVVVACRSNGRITLNIFHPATADGQTQSPVILYLPTGPHAKERWNLDDNQIISALSAASNSTVVRVNYRLGDGVHYPIPIHDVLAGYDYVKKRFTAVNASMSRPGQVIKSSLRVGVCGQLIGGSLAAMLALTESRLVEDSIAAAALNCPVVDWIFPESAAEGGHGCGLEFKKMLKRRKNTPQRTSWESYGDSNEVPVRSLLEGCRKSLFKIPGNYFDPFASPILFLRSPGVPVPGRRLLEEVQVDSLPLPKFRFRKALRTFPPTGSTLVLPNIRLSTGERNPLFDQGEEFVKLLRRSIIGNIQKRAESQAILGRFAEFNLTDDEKLEIAVTAAEERIEYHIHPNSGLWGGPEQSKWIDGVWRTGAWFRRVLTQT